MNHTAMNLLNIFRGEAKKVGLDPDRVLEVKGVPFGKPHPYPMAIIQGPISRLTAMEFAKVVQARVGYLIKVSFEDDNWNNRRCLVDGEPWTPPHFGGPATGNGEPVPKPESTPPVTREAFFKEAERVGIPGLKEFLEKRRRELEEKEKNG